MLNTPLCLLLPAAVSLPAIESLREAVGDGKWLGFILAGNVLGVFACWLSSTLFAAGKSTVKRALLAYLAYLAFIVATVIFLSVALPYVMQTRAPVRLLVFTCGVGLLVLVLSLAIPMKVYETGPFRSFGFFVTTMVIGFGLNVALQTAFFGGEITLEQIPAARVFQRAVDFSTPSPAPRSAAELGRRRDELARRHEQLSIRYKHMSSDPNAIRDYLRDRNAYTKDLSEYERDAAALANQSPPAPR